MQNGVLLLLAAECCNTCHDFDYTAYTLSKGPTALLDDTSGYAANVPSGTWLSMMECPSFKLAPDQYFYDSYTNTRRFCPQENSFMAQRMERYDKRLTSFIHILRHRDTTRLVLST
jgi:hypothetical protein